MNKLTRRSFLALTTVAAAIPACTVECPPNPKPLVDPETKTNDSAEVRAEPSDGFIEVWAFDLPAVRPPRVTSQKALTAMAARPIRVPPLPRVGRYQRCGVVSITPFYDEIERAAFDGRSYGEYVIQNRGGEIHAAYVNESAKHQLIDHVRILARTGKVFIDNVSFGGGNIHLKPGDTLELTWRYYGLHTVFTGFNVRAEIVA